MEIPKLTNCLLCNHPLSPWLAFTGDYKCDDGKFFNCPDKWIVIDFGCPERSYCVLVVTLYSNSVQWSVGDELYTYNIDPCEFFGIKSVYEVDKIREVIELLMLFS